jgi:hypothetical protein
VQLRFHNQSIRNYVLIHSKEFFHKNELEFHVEFVESILIYNMNGNNQLPPKALDIEANHLVLQLAN